MSQLIVLDIDPNGMATALPVAFPVIVNSVLYKFKVSIKKRFGLAEFHWINAADGQGAAEVVPVGGGRVRHQHFTEHRDVLIGVENLA